MRIRRPSLGLIPFLLIVALMFSIFNVSMVVNYKEYSLNELASWIPSGGDFFFSSFSEEDVTILPTKLDKPLFTPQITDPWKRDLYQRLDRVRQVCGDLCDITNISQFEARAVQHDGKNFPTITSQPVNCRGIMESDDIDAGDSTFPFPPPEELLDFYTLHGATPLVVQKRYQQGYLGGKAMTNVWTNDMINDWMAKARLDQLGGTYGGKKTSEVKNKLMSPLVNISGKSALVIGSERPWVEVLCLLAGAASVTTLEYGHIVSEHPQIRTLTPDAFRLSYLNGTLGQFDVIVSHSSLEHSGLGRYGDALNPWGDILAIARAWCVSKPNASMLLGLPAGEDKIRFNMHRVYGKIRWSLVTANWIQIDEADHTDAEFINERTGSGGTDLVFRKIDNTASQQSMI